MARGTVSKDRKITIRLTDEEYGRVKRDAENNNISISEHSRQRILDSSKNTEVLILICNLSTALNKMILKYDIAQEDKELIEKEAGLVWERLS